MLWEHLPERFRQVRTCLVNGTENPASVKLSTPIPSDPFAIGSAVHRPEYWTVFSNMDGPQSSFVVQHRNGILHHQFVLDSSQKRRGLHSAMGRSELQNTRSDVE